MLTTYPSGLWISGGCSKVPPHESHGREPMKLLADAERYYETNREVVDGIVAELKAAGVDDSALDDIAHDVAEEVEASELNNAGFALQVASALEGNGVEDGRRIVLEAADVKTAPRP
jgi:hypothetical protein